MKKTTKLLRLLACATVIAMMTMGLVACAKPSDLKKVQDSGELVVGITLYQPINYNDSDGKLVGFDTELAEAVGEELGVDVKFQVIDWNSKFIELNAGNIDAIWNGFTVTEERKDQVDFSTNYLKNKQSIVVKSSNLSTLNTVEKLSGKKATAEAGSVGESFAKQHTTNYTSVSAQVDALLEVKSGASDFAVMDYTLAGFSIAQAGGSYTDLSIVDTITTPEEFYAVGFRKGSDLTAEVNKVLADLTEDGTLAKIAAKYGLTGLLVD